MAPLGPLAVAMPMTIAPAVESVQASPTRDGVEQGDNRSIDPCSFLMGEEVLFRNSITVP